MQIPSVQRFAPFGEGAVRGGEQISSSLALDLVMCILGIWFIGGVYLDGWAHLHLRQIETFFTPWHGVLYSGYFATAVLLFGVLLRNAAKGYPLARAVPGGYELSMLGAVAFAFGAVGDLVWHTLFGTEAGVEALLSPTHLVLAISSALIVTGPLRAAWLRSGRETKSAGAWTLLPAVLSLTIFYSILTFFTEYASPFAETLAGINRLPTGAVRTLRYQELGVAGFLLQAAILMGIILFALRRWRLPFGSLMVMLTLNTAAMGLMHDGWFSTGTGVMIGVGLLAGLVGDILVLRLAPSPARPTTFRWFAFLMPAALYALYYLALFVFGGGVWWSIHLWMGSIFMAALVGLLLSYLVLPPPALKEG